MSIFNISGAKAHGNVLKGIFQLTANRTAQELACEKTRKWDCGGGGLIPGREIHESVTAVAAVAAAAAAAAAAATTTVITYQALVDLECISVYTAVPSVATTASAVGRENRRQEHKAARRDIDRNFQPTHPIYCTRYVCIPHPDEAAGTYAVRCSGTTVQRSKNVHNDSNNSNNSMIRLSPLQQPLFFSLALYPKSAFAGPTVSSKLRGAGGPHASTRVNFEFKPEILYQRGFFLVQAA